MTTTARISVEIELGWGFHDKKPPSAVAELSDDGSAERAALQWLLDLCDEFEIPITFNIVGHLLLDSCDGNHDGPHTDGWFDRDPGTDVDTDPLFYAPEMAEWIRDAEVNHELCTHTFSHVLCDEVSDAVLDWELGRIAELHTEDVVSLVPPRHRKPPYNLLQRHDIEVLRLPVDEHPPSNPIGRYIWTLTRNNALDEPITVDGVVATHISPVMTLSAPYLSRGVSSPHPAYRLLPEAIRQKRHEGFLKSGLDAAIREESGIHYWTHLYNIAHGAQRQPLRRFMMRLSQNEEITTNRMADVTR